MPARLLFEGGVFGFWHLVFGALSTLSTSHLTQLLQAIGHPADIADDHHKFVVGFFEGAEAGMLLHKGEDSAEDVGLIIA